MPINPVADGSTLPAWNENWNLVIPLLLPHFPDAAPRTALMWTCKDFLYHLTSALDTIKFNYLSDVQIDTSLKRLGEWHPGVSSITLPTIAPAIFKKCLRALISVHHQNTLPALKKLCVDQVQAEILEFLLEVLSASEFVALQSIESAFDAEHQTPALVIQIQPIPLAAPTTADNSDSSSTMLPTVYVQVKLNIPELDPKVFEVLESIRIKEDASGAITLPKLNSEIYKKLLSPSFEKYISDEMSTFCKKVSAQLEKLNNYALLAKALSYRDHARMANRIFSLERKTSNNQPA